ncbi:4-hydroxyphenylpyruvate dioxygenase [Dulcicalothrix desertica PCC 7102]|uniref:4-hydroxyphenylpyruvate dioxygenase n=1 Tax=Dulcicalothrix desertica PCC 7102 TaxID=232991 RepID=A0A433UPY5_9CYAN|nr:4-hydroxyphenylpyruvate dioxygenase [Dulcicalothrix desertica]RUS95910.1 4-hydroxyphenylpyruvate dioxygenase [Dulcicalothrix desertica PCC 7102]TWH39545.1 4-hydroxyphenylpyruvate dioxygenase [Dulcicalothrix desertica PCC 7102]
MKIEHVHFYVEDAKAWRDWFVSTLGFEAVDDYMLPPYPLDYENDNHTCTQVVKSGSICFVLSSPLLPNSPVAEFLRHHPPGVADVAFTVEDIQDIQERAYNYGAKILQPISEYYWNGIYTQFTKIKAWGSLSHTLIETHLRTANHEPRTLVNIDHIVLNVPTGELDNAVTWYEKILDFQPQQSFNIQTENSGLHSRVMISRCGGVQLPINQPATGNSQIQEFLDFNQGAGIQHIALSSSNLLETISLFRSRNLPFLVVPPTYYSKLVTRPGFPLSPSEIDSLTQQEILVDFREDNPGALLLQIFTQPIFGQPTFFFEFIERRNLAKGFGEGNFRALFEAIEREQLKRALE